MSKNIGKFKPDLKHVELILGPIEPHHISLRYALGMTYKGTRHNCYRDDKLSIQKEAIGNNITWYIDGDEREFKTVEAMLDALNEKLKPTINAETQSS